MKRNGSRYPMTMTSIDEILKQIYYDPSNPAGLASVKKLYDSVKHLNVSKKYVNHWLSKQNSHVFHKQTINKFTRNRVLVNSIDEEFQADLMDIRHVKWNHGRYHYILTVIDVLSKFAFATPIKRKSGIEVAAALRKIFEQRTPHKLHSDRGLEFLNSHVEDVLNEFNVYQTTTKDKLIKASVVERFNRTLRMKLEKLRESNPKFKFEESLQMIINAYNNSVHRSIKMKPVDVNIDTQDIAFKNLYGGKTYMQMLTQANSKKAKFSVGDFVRIKLDKETFQRGYHRLWSDQAFRISRIITTGQVITYYLRDSKNLELDRRYYEKELQKIAPPTFKIKQVLNKRIKNGETEFQVIYDGFSNQPIWIPERDIFNINERE